MAAPLDRSSLRALPGEQARRRDVALVEQARGAAPLRRALAALAGRIVASQAWAELGYARLADYVRERAGLTAGFLHELARVDAGLRRLPALEATFVGGEIPWTKARLVAGVATPEDEGVWLAAAGRLASDALAREVRGVDARAAALAAPGPAGTPLGERDAAGALLEPRAGARFRCSGYVRAKLHRVRWLAQRVAGQALPPWACMDALAGEVASALPPEPEAPAPAAQAAACRKGPFAEAARRERSPGAKDESAGPEVRTDGGEARDGGTGGDASPSGPAGVQIRDEPRGPGEATSDGPPVAVPAFVAALLNGLEEASPRELDARLRRAARLEQGAAARLGAELLALATSRGFRDLGYGSLDAYASERLGMAPSRAKALLAIERACELSPALRAGWREGRLSWSQAQELLPLVRLGHAERWMESWVGRAQEVTVRRLRDDVEAALATDRLDPAELPALPAEPGSASTPETGPLGGSVAAASAGVPFHPAGVQIRGEPTGSEHMHSEAEPALYGSEPARSGPGSAADSPPDPAREHYLRELRRIAAWRAEARRGRVDRAEFRLTGPEDVVTFFRGVVARVQRLLERHHGRPSSECEALDAMCDHALEEWTARLGARSARERRDQAICERDGWRCTVPGCTSHRGLQVHHLHFRSAGGGDEPENLTTLCAAHHLRGVHRGAVRIAGRAPEGLRFDLPVGRWRAGDVVMPG